jgi:methylmalonyl-CoA/ethylmalonyl-CoA epimerase
MIDLIEHVGIVVDNLDQAKAFAGQALGLQLVRENELPERGVKFAFYGAGGVQIEFIEPTRPDIREKRLGVPGTLARMEHLAVIVNRLDEAESRLAGYGVVMQPRVKTPGRTWAMTDPQTSGGVIYQVVELDS